MGRHVARMEESRSAFKMLTGKPTRYLGRPRLRWADSTRIGLKETGVNTKTWILIGYG